MKPSLLHALLMLVVLRIPAQAQIADGNTVTYVSASVMGVQAEFLLVDGPPHSVGMWDISGLDPQRRLLAEEESRNSAAVYLKFQNSRFEIDMRNGRILHRRYDEPTFSREIGIISFSIPGPRLPDRDRQYTIKAKHSGKPMGLPGSSRTGATLFQSSAHEVLNTFMFRRDPESGFYYILRSDDPNQSLDVEGGNPGDGVRIVQTGAQGRESQRFLLVPVNQFYFRIATYYGKFLEVYGGPSATLDNTPITQSTVNSGDNQLFMLEEVSVFDGSGARQSGP